MHAIALQKQFNPFLWRIEILFCLSPKTDYDFLTGMEWVIEVPVAKVWNSLKCRQKIKWIFIYLQCDHTLKTSRNFSAHSVTQYNPQIYEQFQPTLRLKLLNNQRLNQFQKLRHSKSSPPFEKNKKERKETSKQTNTERKS